MTYTIREANANDADRINELFIQMLQKDIWTSFLSQAMI